MIDIIPVSLIQALYERQRCLQDELQTLQALRAQEVLLQAELDRVEAFLSTYPVYQAAADADVDLTGVAPVSAASTVQDCLEAILASHGPARAIFLKRQLWETYGVRVADSSLWDLLQRGLTDGRYVKSKQFWRLASRQLTPVPEDEEVR